MTNPSVAKREIMSRSEIVVASTRPGQVGPSVTRRGRRGADEIEGSTTPTVIRSVDIAAAGLQRRPEEWIMVDPNRTAQAHE